MERTVFCRVGKWFVRLDTFLDEETWPGWLRGVLSVALVAFIFGSLGIVLAVTP